jgi:hypothetical protein
MSFVRPHAAMHAATRATSVFYMSRLPIIQVQTHISPLFE